MFTVEQPSAKDRGHKDSQLEVGPRTEPALPQCLCVQTPGPWWLFLKPV